MIKMYKQLGAKICFGNLSKSQAELIQATV